MKILSIDAWKEDQLWVWNNWYKIGEIDKETFEGLNTNRKLIKWMRDNGYLSEKSKGMVSIDDDQYNIVFCDRNKSHMPVYAIEYGPEY